MQPNLVGAIDGENVSFALVKGADDAKCLKAMTPSTEAPSDEPD